MNNYIKNRAKEHGFATGQDAQYMRTVGATDQQIRNYVNFRNQQTPTEYKQSFIIGARNGFTEPLHYDHPIYDAHKRNLKWYVEHNAACVQ